MLRELDRAIDDGDRQRASRLLLGLQPMRPPEELLGEFAAAVRQEEYEEARTVLELLEKTYDEQAVEESARFERAMLSRSRTELSQEERERLDAHHHQATTVELERGAFLLEAAGFLTDPDRTANRTILDSTRQLQNREQEFSRVQDDTRPIVEDSPLPPRVRLLSANVDTMARDESQSLVVTAGNIGDEQANDIRVSVSPKQGLTVSDGSTTIDQIKPDDFKETIFDVKGGEVGEFRLEVDLESANAGTDSELVTVQILAPQTDTESDLVDDLPDWIVPVGGVGTLGAGAYVALKYLGDRRSEAR